MYGVAEMSQQNMQNKKVPEKSFHLLLQEAEEVTLWYSH